MGSVLWDWDPWTVINVVRTEVQRTNNHRLVILNEVKALSNLKGTDKILKILESLESGLNAWDVAKILTCSSLCRGESSQAAGSRRRRTGFPPRFFDSSSKYVAVVWSYFHWESQDLLEIVFLFQINHRHCFYSDELRTDWNIKTIMPRWVPTHLLHQRCSALSRLLHVDRHLSNAVFINVAKL